jgi:RNA recognition motif-containing protein
MTFSPQTSIHIRNLPADTTEEALFSAYKLFGTVLGCQVKKEKESLDRTFGFVNFNNA